MGENEIIDQVRDDTDLMTKPKRPNMYKVIIINDDYTSMEFVIYVFKRHFNKTDEEARALTLEVHQKGIGIAGLYTYEVADMKCRVVMTEARQRGFPLQLTAEIE